MLAYLRQYALLVVAGGILCAGLATSIYDFVAGLDNREYLALNARTNVTLQPGTYEIFYEYNESKTQVGPVTYTRNNKIVTLPELVTVMVNDGSASVQLAEDRSTTYQVKRKKGESLYRFKAEKAGSYGVTVISNAPDLQDHVRFTLMKDFAHGLLAILKRLGMFLAAAVPILAAGLIVYARMEKRKFGKKKATIL